MMPESAERNVRRGDRAPRIRCGRTFATIHKALPMPRTEGNLKTAFPTHGAMNRYHA
jgi:hypothetical protein